MWRVWRIGRYCVSHRDMIGDSNGDWYCANNYHLNTCSLTSTLLATSHPKYTDLKRWLNEGNRLAILCVYGMTIEQAEEYVKECEK